MSEFKGYSGTHTVKSRRTPAMIFISSVALYKMRCYVESCNDEIGWLGLVRRVDNGYYFYDTLLFTQEVHSTTTEIDPEKLGEFISQMMVEDPDHAEQIFEHTRLWGHSHVNMGITPSGQDISMFNTLAGAGSEFFVRVIANKKGDIRFDLIDNENELEYTNVPWTEHRPDLEGIRKEVEEEIKLKVSKKKYTYNRETVTNTATRTTTTTGGTEQTGSKANKKTEEKKSEQEKKAEVVREEVKKNMEWAMVLSDMFEDVYGLLEKEFKESTFYDAMEICEYFGLPELNDLLEEVPDVNILKKDANNYYGNIFNEIDLELIYKMVLIYYQFVLNGGDASVKEDNTV